MQLQDAQLLMEQLPLKMLLLKVKIQRRRDAGSVIHLTMTMRLINFECAGAVIRLVSWNEVYQE